MKYNFKPTSLPGLVALLGAAAMVLRLELYASAVDEKNLLLPNHPLEMMLMGLTAAVLVIIVFSLWPLYGSLHYGDNFPASKTAAAGAAAGAAGMILGVLLAEFQPGKLYLAWKLLGLTGGACLALTGYARLKGSRPHFLLYAGISVFWLVHLVSHYRGWSVEPQLQDYLFQLLASVALLMFSYYQTAFSAGSGKRRTQMAVGLAAGYFSLVSLSGCDTPLLYGGCAVWALTNLCSLIPVRRRAKPAQEGE